MIPKIRFRQQKIMNRSDESTYVGLQILTTTSPTGNSGQNVVSKSSVKPNRNISADYCCYLKKCHLCKKKLRHDKDVYMYRGNLGFCSVKCRDSQILMDERRELEVSTQQMLASNYRHCNSGAGKSEIRVLLDDLRRSRAAHETHWVTFS